MHIYNNNKKRIGGGNNQIHRFFFRPVQPSSSCLLFPLSFLFILGKRILFCLAYFCAKARPESAYCPLPPGIIFSSFFFWAEITAFALSPAPLSLCLLCCCCCTLPSGMYYVLPQQLGYKHVTWRIHHRGIPPGAAGWIERRGRSLTLRTLISFVNGLFFNFPTRHWTRILSRHLQHKKLLTKRKEEKICDVTK